MKGALGEELALVDRGTSEPLRLVKGTDKDKRVGE